MTTQSKHEGASCDKLLSSLGLCARARALICGTPMICEALRLTKPPVLVIEASDTSDNTHKRLTDKCQFYHVTHIRIPAAADELGRAVGKKTAVAAVALRDESFVRLLQPQLEALGLAARANNA